MDWFFGKWSRNFWCRESGSFLHWMVSNQQMASLSLGILNGNVLSWIKSESVQAFVSQVLLHSNGMFIETIQETLLCFCPETLTCYVKNLWFFCFWHENAEFLWQTRKPLTHCSCSQAVHMNVLPWSRPHTIHWFLPVSSIAVSWSNVGKNASPGTWSLDHLFCVLSIAVQPTCFWMSS